MAEPEEEKNGDPEEIGKEEQEAPPQNNTVLKPEDLEAIKAELEEERKAKAQIEAALAQKDALIADLQNQLSEAKRGFESTTAELTTLKDAHSKAVAKYLDAVKLANPTLPGDVIAGSTIEEIDASVQKAIAIAESVKKSLEAQAKEAKVPAGAPTRGGISVEGLSAREKIALGIQQKGTSP